MKEGLRLHSPAPLLVPHESIKPCKVYGYNIPARTQLFVNVYAIHHDAKVWSNPLEFNPERFMDGGGEAKLDLKGQHFEFLPFGSGRRMCPGQAMGMIMLQSMVANLLHAFSWHTSEDIDLSEGVTGIVVPIRVKFSPHAKVRLPLALYKK